MRMGYAARQVVVARAVLNPEMEPAPIQRGKCANGMRQTRSSARIRAGDTLTFALHGHVRVIKLSP